MTVHHDSLIDCAPPASGKKREVRSPFDGRLLGTVALADGAAVERALAGAHALFRDRRQWLPVSRRCEILRAAAAIMRDRRDELIRTAASEGGKPWGDSAVEVGRAIEGVELCAEAIGQHAGRVIQMREPDPDASRMAFTQKEPIGPVLAISAFNHPLNLIVHQVGAAVAAGCPALVKPAASTPLSCFGFVSLLHQAGLPPAWCQALLPENLELSGKMAADARLGFLSFIGSAAVGWMLRSRLAPGVRCALEHGGVAPVIVDESADVERLVPALLKGGYYHAGQVCVSVQRVFAPRALCDGLAERLAAGASALSVGDPLDAATEVGPLISPEEQERVHQWVSQAVDGGARLACGGQRLDNNCYAPTLLVDPPADADVSRREVFGPVVCLYGYERLDDAIAQANSLDFAFQAAVFAQDIDRAMAIYHQLDASAVMINDHTAFRQDQMPFAGLRQSGLGIGGIEHSINDMQIEKMMVLHGPRIP